MNNLKHWLLDQQSNLDIVMDAAARSYYNDHRSLPYFKFDVNECIKEIKNLNYGQDLCYDRPSIGFAYALWYHGRRMNGMLDFFIKLLYEARNEESVQIFDLGAGTGAMQSAVSIVAIGMKACNLPVPKIKIINIDSSPFMLEYNEKYLSQELAKKYPDALMIDVDYKLISWTNQDSYEYSNVWLCASYLFDHSENEQTIKEVFKELTKTYRPQKVLLFGNWIKRAKVDLVAKSLAESYSSRFGQATWSFYKGDLDKVQEFRNECVSDGINFYDKTDWNNKTWYGKVLEPIQQEMNLSFPNEYTMYQRAEQERTKIKLTKEQRKAAEITNNPTIILGPAGCGKSVVLTEKVKNIVEQVSREYDVKLRILLTTFNKDLVKYLGDWLEQILDSSKFTRTYDYTWEGDESAQSYFKFEGSDEVNITVMHFDVLPSRIGNIKTYKSQPPQRNYKNYHKDRIKKAVKNVQGTLNIEVEKYIPILTEDFLLEEYHRVKYGLQCNTSEDYQQISRIGRGANPQLQKGKMRRQIIISIFREYKRLLKIDGCESYIIRRERFLKKLNDGHSSAGAFTHLVIDELQDCCYADYDIFYALLSDPNNLTVAGDLAQAINIGTTAQIPRPKNESMRRFQRIYIEGSFRLPFRISECIRPISESIKEKFASSQNSEVYEIKPFKGAPPGSRPIFVYQPKLDEMGKVIKEIYDAYKVYDKSIGQVDVMEFRTDFIDMLELAGLKANGRRVQKIKGMEMPFVIWNTFAEVDTREEFEEFVYTILTRTTNVLVIAINEKVIIPYFSIIKKFEKDRLLFWDERSRKVYENICDREFDPDKEDSGHDEDMDQDTEIIQL